MQSNYTKKGKNPVNKPTQQPPPNAVPNGDGTYTVNAGGIGWLVDKNGQMIQGGLVGVSQNLAQQTKDNVINPIVEPITNFLNILQSDKFWLNTGGIVLGLILVIIAFSVIARGSVTNVVTNAIKKGKK